ncbi:unnamed protein product [Rotaria sordida]|uniref:Calpain catalytic domain-containing protein n=2 Tax=Rotaria sordida TaxID=392033 RepID=A0A813XUK8_9BILA|nr:unnamed protein product [Rotaria sordida]
MFHFRFWLFGEWNDVIIDDRLPCYMGKLVFCRNNKDPNELWAPLLEKAYAKVYGSYEVLAGGFITDGLVDLTGGMDEVIMFDEELSSPDFKEKIKRLILQAFARKSIVGCVIFNTLGTEGILPNGLVSGHAYSVTQMKDLTIPNGTITLVRCLNPWNNSAEWNGKWSDNSPLWDQVAEGERRKLKFQRSHDGEFWMSYDDFFDNFHGLQICHCNLGSLGVLGADSSTANSCQKAISAWHETVFHGKWKQGESAGGSGLDGGPPEKYWTNPQYLIKLEFIDGGIEEKWCTMIISLMFKENRQRILNGEETVYVAFDIYKVKDNADIRTHIEGSQKYYMTHLDYLDISGLLIQFRSINKRLKVRPGTYIIIPYTLECDQGGEFFLRIFTEKQANQTVSVELTNNKENLTESETKRPHLKIDNEDNNQPDDAPESSDEETNDATEDKGDASPGSDSKKTNPDIDPNNKDAICTIQ